MSNKNNEYKEFLLYHRWQTSEPPIGFISLNAESIDYIKKQNNIDVIHCFSTVEDGSIRIAGKYYIKSNGE